MFDSFRKAVSNIFGWVQNRVQNIFGRPDPEQVIPVQFDYDHDIEPERTSYTVPEIYDHVQNTLGGFTNDVLEVTLTSVSTGARFSVRLLEGLTSLYFLIRDEFTEVHNYDRILISQWKPSVFDRMFIDVERIAGGCAETTSPKTYRLYHYSISTISPSSSTNDCFFECLKLYDKGKFTVSGLRKSFNLNKNTPLTPDTVRQICQQLEIDVTILVRSCTLAQIEAARRKSFILFLNDKHYEFVTSINMLKSTQPKKSFRKKMGILFYDLETRPFVIAGIDRFGNKIFRQKETIIAITYKSAYAKRWTEQIFETDLNSFAGEKFLKFLEESEDAYECYAHNGSRFDIFFLLSYMSSEHLVSKLSFNAVLRGCSVLKFKFNDHVFKDTCAFLTNDLATLCRDFKPKHRKQADAVDLCFYKPELDFYSFMRLRETEPDFWNKYREYCLFDVLSLRDIFELFNKELDLLCSAMSIAAGKPSSFLSKDKNCNTTACITIGSMAKKMFLALAEDKLEKVYEFFGNPDSEECLKKYNYLQSFVRGGISYVQYPGIHNESIALYDIKSMYPAAMVNMKCPVGTSYFLNAIEAKVALERFRPGFYRLKNVKFIDNRFKPVAIFKKEDAPRIGEFPSLCWNQSFYETLDIDSYMFQSIQHQIESYEVIDALVSYNDICCSTLFDSYVQVLYQKKQEQDDLPKDKRNDALRETIKLFLNSLSGKLIENPSNQREYKLYSSGKIEFINGEAFSEETSTSVNRLFTLGLMIYSFSKRLLFSYINCLPNQEKDVIASETDSIYIPASVVEKFEENIKSSSVYRNHSCVGIGSKLGNFAYEGSSNSPSYFLGKKQYYFGSEKPKLKFKGLREKYIDTDGTLKKVLTKRTFEELYDTGEIDVPQSILDRCLTSRCAIDKVHIESYNTMKKFRANYEFSNYDFIHNKITKN